VNNEETSNNGGWVYQQHCPEEDPIEKQLVEKKDKSGGRVTQKSQGKGGRLLESASEGCPGETNTMFRELPRAVRSWEKRRGVASKFNFPCTRTKTKGTESSTFGGMHVSEEDGPPLIQPSVSDEVQRRERME